MKKIIISGYYGFDNLGDEAVLAGIISLLKVKNENIRLTVLSAVPEKTAELYNVNAVNRNSIIQILAELAEADLFISGGGSLLQDITGNFSVPYYLGLAWLAKIQGAKTVCYAQGIGPLNKKWSQKLTAFSFNNFNFLGVRDKASRKLLKDIGVKKEVKLTVDPVFGLYDSVHNKRRKIKAQVEVGISVRPWSVNYINQLAAALNQFSKNKNIKYILFPMHKGTDEEISKELMNKLNSKSELRELPAAAEKALSEFSQLDLFVGVRLHSLIFALLNQLPLLALSYDPKIEALMAELDYLPLMKLNDIKEERVREDLEYLLAERYSIRKKLAGFLKSKKAAAENFADLVIKEVDSCES